MNDELERLRYQVKWLRVFVLGLVVLVAFLLCLVVLFATEYNVPTGLLLGVL